MTWISEAAETMAGRGDNRCQAGHSQHLMKEVEVDLSKHKIPDVPVTTGKMSYKIFDWAAYQGTPCYCPGNDEVSLSVETQGVWEGFETALALEIVRKEAGVILDFGANSGWYSTLLAKEGCDVLAVEADEDNARLLKLNAFWNEVGHKVVLSRGWICSDTPILDPGPRIRFLKSDVEGMEDQVVRACSQLFTERLIDYAALEVSPVFAPHYPETLKFIVDCGYAPFLVPDKGFDPVEFGGDPLGSVLRNPLDLGIVPELYQRTVLMVRT